jgi:hypothetical protein
VSSDVVRKPFKGPIHSKLNCSVELCKNTAGKPNLMFSGTAQVSHKICQFICQLWVSSCACDYCG